MILLAKLSINCLEQKKKKIRKNIYIYIYIHKFIYFTEHRRDPEFLKKTSILWI